MNLAAKADARKSEIGADRPHGKKNVDTKTTRFNRYRRSHQEVKESSREAEFSTDRLADVNATNSSDQRVAELTGNRSVIAIPIIGGENEIVPIKDRGDEFPDPFGPNTLEVGVDGSSRLNPVADRPLKEIA